MLASVFDALSAKERTLPSASLFPIKSLCALFFLVFATDFLALRTVSSRLMAATSVSISKGLSKKSFTPRWIDSIALERVAFPVIMITSYLPPSCLTNSIPSILGILMSVMTRSKLSSSFLSASVAFLKVTTSNSL